MRVSRIYFLQAQRVPKSAGLEELERCLFEYLVLTWNTYLTVAVKYLHKLIDKVCQNEMISKIYGLLCTGLWITLFSQGLLLKEEKIFAQLSCNAKCLSNQIIAKMMYAFIKTLYLFVFLNYHYPVVAFLFSK